VPSLLAAFYHLRVSGEILAVGSGLIWAIAVILYRISGRRVHPLGLNLFKNILALACTVPVLILLGRPLWPAVPPKSLWLLLLSGFLGIAISDTLFFYALNRLGASIMAIVDCFYSPFVIGLSFLILAERMTGWQLIGVALIISAVFTAERAGPGDRVSGKDLAIGSALGILSMFFVAIGIVIAKPVLATESVLFSTFIRLIGGAVPLVIIVPLLKNRRELLAPLLQWSNWRAMVPASFFGSFLSLVLWMGGMKYAKASVAAALSQLNTIFIVVLAVLFLREKLTGWKIAAVGLAIVGAYLAAFPL